MTPAVAKARERIEALKTKLKRAKRQLQELQAKCPHKNRDWWSYGDGDGAGSFTVQLCLDCGLQRNGAL